MWSWVGSQSAPTGFREPRRTWTSSWATKPSSTTRAASSRFEPECRSRSRVAVDFIGAEPTERFLAAALEAEPGSIIEGPPLVYMKLKSPRHKDRTDVIELIKAGLDVNACRVYLATNAPSFVAELDAAVERAQAEDE